MLVNWATEHFLKGGEFKEVVDKINKKYNKPEQINSKHTVYSQIRSSVIKVIKVNPLPGYDLSPLKKYQNEECVSSFLNLPIEKRILFLTVLFIFIQMFD